MSTITNTRLLSSKSNVGNTRVDHVEQSLTLEPGEALLAIDTFALTTNNITYAAFGESMRYWDFFPTQLEGWGQIAYTGAIRTPIPALSGHPFRFNPDTDSGINQPVFR